MAKMTSTALQDQLARQVSREQSTANFYEAAALQASMLALPGCEKWFRAAADEERVHSRKISFYLAELFGIVAPVGLDPMGASTLAGKSLYDIFVAADAKEREFLQIFSDISMDAIESREAGIHQFVQWFVEEQQNAVRSLKTIIDMTRNCSDVADFLLVDQYVGGLV